MQTKAGKGSATNPRTSVVSVELPRPTEVARAKESRLVVAPLVHRQATLPSIIGTRKAVSVNNEAVRATTGHKANETNDADVDGNAVRAQSNQATGLGADALTSAETPAA